MIEKHDAKIYERPQPLKYHYYYTTKTSLLRLLRWRKV